MKLAGRAKGVFLSRHWLALSVFFFAAIAMVCWSMWITFAANRTWTGGTPGDPACSSPNPLWTNPCNWTNKVLPSAGDDLIFGSSLQASSTNSFANGTTFNSISISAGHLMTGNSVTLNAGITANNGQISLSAIKLNANQTFTAPTAGTGGVLTSVVDNNAKTLTVDGPGNFTMTGLIAGTGGLVKSGAGTLILAGPNTYSGPTTVNAGTLLVFGSQPQSNVVLSPVFGTSATLGGSGAVGVISDNGQGFATISPGAANNGTGILTANGNVVFSPIAQDTFEVDLNGATVGSGYDQIKVNGTLILNNVSSPLTVNLGFTPAPGTTFIIADNDGVDAVSGTFAGHSEGSIFTVNGTTFFITYKGGDGNDVVLHVPEIKTWSGGGADSNWTTGGNWQGGSAPQPGDILQFAPGSVPRKTNTNDFPAATPFSQIALTGGGYQISGNAIKILNNLLNNAASGGTNFFRLDMSGPGGLTANGVALVLSGNNTFTGTTNLISGVVAINGFQTASPIVVSGGTLRGIGTTGPVTATGGAVTPGDSGGDVLSIDGTLTLNPAATYRPTLLTNPTNRFLRLSVNGSVDLGGSTLDISDLSGVPGPGESFKIIDKTNSGLVQGTFAGKPEGALFDSIAFNGTVTYRISYVGGDGNDVTLTVPTTRTWDGGGANSVWSNAQNWVNDIAPSAGDNLVFPPGVARLTTINDFPAGTTFNSITFSAPGYTLAGTLIRLNAGIARIDAGTSGDAVTLPLQLNANQTFSIPAGTNLFLNNIDTNGCILTFTGGGNWNPAGAITGSGGLTFNGSGLVQITNAGGNTFTGPTIVNSGRVQLVAAQPNSPLVINGGQVFGVATVKSIFGTGGTIHPQFPGAMSSIGNVNLNSGLIFDTAINRDVSSATSVTFSVGGDVSLGNCALTINANFQAPPTFTDTFKIVDKTSGGPIQGIFNNLPEGATLMVKGYPFRISYIGGDGNDVVLTLLPPIIFVEQGTSNRAVTLDSVTLVRDPLPLNTDHNFSVDHRTRVILLTSSLGLNQPDPSVLTVQAAGFNLTVEGVGPITGVTGLDGSYIVLRLPEGLPPGDLQMAITLRGLTSNTAILRISP